jgi:arsenite-transporting ATPase
VFRKADELFVRVGSYKRNLVLPQTLQRLEVKGASFVEERLEIRFARQADRPAQAGSR